MTPAHHNVITAPLILEIMAGYTLPPRGIHGVAHWGRVLETGLRLAVGTGADPAVIALFAVLHDARRRDEGDDPGHGARGAALARHLRRLLPLDDAQFEELTHACTHHTDGATAGSLTVRTCWDADRLDLWRVGIRPDDRWLCTDTARDAVVQAWARDRSVADHLPECARGWLDDGDPVV